MLAVRLMVPWVGKNLFFWRWHQQVCLYEQDSAEAEDARKLAQRGHFVRDASSVDCYIGVVLISPMATFEAVPLELMFKI